MINWLVNKALAIFKLVFLTLEKCLFALSNFINKTTNKYRKITNKVLQQILRQDWNNKELVVVMKVLFWIFGIAIAIYLYTLVHSAIKEITNWSYPSKINSFFVEKISNNNSNLPNFHYWTSTLYLLIKSNQFHVF